MKYELLNNLSGAAVLIMMIMIFLMVIKPRYSKKQYLLSLIPFLSFIFIINFYVIFHNGFLYFAKYTLFSTTIPSLIYFYIISEYRDWRFFFTLLLVDTSSIWFAMLTGFIDYFTSGEGRVNFIIRLIAIPIILYIINKYFRDFFLTLLNKLNEGWWIFTVLTSVVYLMLIFITSYPISIRERPDDIPLAFLILIILPLVYITCFYVLNYQKKIHDMDTLQHIFLVQSTMIEIRAKELKATDDKLRIQRHDLRHELKIIEELTKKGEKDKALKYIDSIDNSIENAKIKHYCEDPILDTTISFYIDKAKDNYIHFDSNLSFPKNLPVPALDLAIIFSNALENAICDCDDLPPNERKIIFKCISEPTLMFEIKNTHTGRVQFDNDGFPISNDYKQIIANQSITAFCKKHSATYIYSVKDDWFSLKIGL